MWYLRCYCYFSQGNTLVLLSMGQQRRWLFVVTARPSRELSCFSPSSLSVDSAVGVFVSFPCTCTSSSTPTHPCSLPPMLLLFLSFSSTFCLSPFSSLFSSPFSSPFFYLLPILVYSTKLFVKSILTSPSDLILGCIIVVLLSLEFTHKIKTKSHYMHGPILVIMMIQVSWVQVWWC